MSEEPLRRWLLLLLVSFISNIDFEQSIGEFKSPEFLVPELFSVLPPLDSNSPFPRSISALPFFVFGEVTPSWSNFMRYSFLSPVFLPRIFEVLFWPSCNPDGGCWLPKVVKPLAMLLKESTSKEVLKIPLAGVPIVEPRKGNMSVSLSFGVFLDRPLNWNKSRDGLFLDMVTDGQARREGALPDTFSVTPVFVDKLTDLGLPVKNKEKKFYYLLISIGKILLTNNFFLTNTRTTVWNKYVWEFQIEVNLICSIVILLQISAFS